MITRLSKIILITCLLLNHQTAFADEWGCQVLLCMADPGGPTTQAECKPPIEKLWTWLKKGRAFPTCEEAGDPASSAGSYTKQVYDFFDPCPEHYKAMKGYVAEPNGGDLNSLSAKDALYSVGQGGRVPGRLACVRNQIGSYYTVVNYLGQYVNIYDDIIWQDPQSPNAIDVYVDAKLYKRIRM